MLGHVQSKVQKVQSGDRPYNTVGGELDSRNLKASGALLQTGFYNFILRPSRYQLPEKMFQERGRLKRCCCVLGETAKGRKNQPGNGTSISVTHSSLKNTRE